MHFDEGYLYHIYNQGNNRRKIFFNRDNYLFFLKKINTYILPYTDILAWCLMPNHFHLMVRIKEKNGGTYQMAQSHKAKEIRKRDLTTSIAIMLRSYTRAINKQNNQSGSLFRAHTKYECLNCQNQITPNFIINNGVTQINIEQAEKEYPKVCFNYIHANPTKAKLVKNDIDWEFSSAIDYFGDRKGKLVNVELAKEYKLI